MKRFSITLLVFVIFLLLLYGFGTGRLHISPLKLSSLPVRAAGPAPACCDVTGTPTVSAAFINRVLTYYHSPASGIGATIYALGVKYDINPVYALAFFMHESSFGTAGMATVTFSPGNLRCAAGFPCINGYRAYSSWASGFASWYDLIRNLYIDQWHLTTVERIIPTYAPTGDSNDVAAYIAAVERAVTSWQRGHVEVAA